VEDVVYRMFEIHMDDYLAEEEEWVKEALDAICKEWESKVREHTRAWPLSVESHVVDGWADGDQRQRSRFHVPRV
jgi:hypothetical protein